MDKKLLKQLIDYSYINSRLYVEKVNRIVKLLKNRRYDLKLYVKGLKLQERKLSVFIDVPMANLGSYKNKFEKIFPNKKIIFNVDQTLMLGVRITDNDNVFEMNLKKTIGNIMSSIEQNYD